MLGGVVEPTYVEITIFGCVASYTDEGLIGYIVTVELLQSN